MFPLSISGKIKINDTASYSPRTIEDEIASALLVNGIVVDYQPDGGIIFRPDIVHHLGMTFLLGISSGHVLCAVHPAALHISYSLRFFHLTFLVSLVMIICKWLEVTFSPARIPAEYYLMVWIWLVAGNIMVTLHEFRRFLRSCAADSGERIFYWRK
jgi:hypothetical protein